MSEVSAPRLADGPVMVLALTTGQFDTGDTLMFVEVRSGSELSSR